VKLGKDTRWLPHKPTVNSDDTPSVYLSQRKSESQPKTNAQLPNKLASNGYDFSSALKIKALHTIYVGSEHDRQKALVERT
jgi:hypothetical protein